MIPKSVTVNGLKLDFPEYNGEEILFADLPEKEQKWKRQEIPEHFEGDWWEDPNEEQLAFYMRELDRILNGVWISIKGDVYWITGPNYFYLNYWVLQDGICPEFRTADVRFFWFWEIASRYRGCLGVLFTKFRRQGASSRGACLAVYYLLTDVNINEGIISKTGVDAKDIFTNMVVKGFKDLSNFLKPRSAGSEKAKSELEITAQSGRMTKGKKIVGSSEGLNNKVDWRTTALNSYDSGQYRFLFIDEAAKWPKDVPFNKYWNIAKRVLVKGAVRVGLAYIPSTVNEMDKGGASYKKVWDASNHLDKNFDGKTASRLFKYFQPAYDGYEGYVGPYGESIIDTPTEEQKAFLREQMRINEELEINPEIGAKEYQLRERKRLAEIGDEEALSEYIRQHPHVEREAFYKVAKDSHFNPMHINTQLQTIEDMGVKPRRVNFVRDLQTEKVRIIEAHDGRWLVHWDFPDLTLSNKCSMRRGGLEPLNTREFAMGCDPFSHTVVSGKGSMAAAFIHRKYNPLDPNNSDMPIAMYWARTKKKETMFSDWALAAEYYGCKIGVEEINDEYYTWFTDNQLEKFLIWTPVALSRTNQNKAIKMRPGIPATSQKAIEYHLTIMVDYMLFNWNKIWFADLLNDMMDFDVEDRTVFDLTMAFGYSLITAREMDVRPVVESTELKHIMPTYSLKTGSRY